MVIPTEGPSFQFTLVCIFARIPPNSSDSSSTAGVHGEKAATHLQNFSTGYLLSLSSGRTDEQVIALPTYHRVFEQSIESEKTKDIQRRNQRHRTTELKSKLVSLLKL